MPAAAPTLHAPIAQQLHGKPYILGIHPSQNTPHLLLRHPSAEITIADNQSLQPVDVLKGGHNGHVTEICAVGDAIWSSAKDATIVRWDERGRRPGMTIKAFVRKPLPVLALAVAERDNLVIGGTELVSSEAHILFWDTRNVKEPVYSHSSTHSDDITHLSILPPTQTFLASSSSNPLPSQLLLSSSTDGLVALSNLKESDEDEAVLCAENWGQSIAEAGSYLHKGTMKIWARSDMDGVGLWDIGKGEEEPAELQNHISFDGETFKGRTFTPALGGASVARAAVEEREDKSGRITSDYLINVAPSLGINKKGIPMTAVGSNAGEIVVLHKANDTFQSSGYFLPGPGARGHQDVVRSLYHDVRNEAIYTGSEDGVLAGWSLAFLPNRLKTGDPDIDDDGGDGREDIASEDEESEIETEDEDDDMDVDGSDEGKEEGGRYGPIIGGGSRTEGRKQKRRDGRPQPY